MIFPEGIFTFGVLLLGYVGFISLKMGIAPWKLFFYDFHIQKKEEQ